MFSVIMKYLPKVIPLRDGIVKKLRGVFEEVQLTYNLTYGFLSEITPTIKAKELTVNDLTDIGFLCREMAKIFDELRKECEARQNLCGSIIAYQLITKTLTDPNASMKSKGELATGTPKLKMQAALPKKFTPEYYQITDFMGVPRDVAETGVLRLDWRRVVEYCTEMAEKGKKMPEGFGKQYPLYTTTFRKRRGV